jgi:hypothetical protein
MTEAKRVKEKVVEPEVSAPEPEQEKPLVPTSLDQIRNVRKEDVVELPPFLDGTPLVARLRRPSLVQMVQHGQIPNPLSNVVDEMLSGKEDMRSNLKERTDVLIAIAKAAMVEPTYEQVEEVITTPQLTGVFIYVVQGAAMLEPFCEISKIFTGRSYEQAVRDATERAAESE